jgi:hypothetical protein
MSLAASTRPAHICAGCGETIKDSTRISDGVDYWHVSCKGRTKKPEPHAAGGKRNSVNLNAEPANLALEGPARPKRRRSPPRHKT